MADQQEGHPGGGFGGGGGVPFHFHGGGGGPGGMSQEEANAFFAQFFGHDDPFGGGGGSPFGHFIHPGMGGMGGMPGGMRMGGMHGMPGMMGGMPRRRPQQRRYDAIPPGTVVSFHHLVGQAHRNGDRGEIQDYDVSSGRYTVLVEDSDELLRLKPENLLQHVSVRLNGIESQPALNGKQGTVLAWDKNKERYNIYVMDLSKVVSLKPGNVILKDGTVGRITGLMSKPALNGRYGTIKSYVRDSNRYDVQLSSSQIIRVKVDNIIV